MELGKEVVNKELTNRGKWAITFYKHENNTTYDWLLKKFFQGSASFCGKKLH